MKQADTSIGAHALVHQRLGGSLEVLRTPPLSSATSESILLAGVGRGQLAASEAPGDNLNGVTFTQLGASHAYTRWPHSGTALYVLRNARGGSSHVVYTSTPPGDEVTLAVVEVFGDHIEDVAWNEVRYPDNFWRLRRWLFSRNTVTSGSVTTSGPATLVAFWWGDAAEENPKSAIPGDGFTVIDALLDEGPLVQCAVAVRRVGKAGRYDVSWTSSPLQGAQMWLVAIADR